MALAPSGAMFGTAGVAITTTPGRNMDTGNGANSDAVVKRAKVIAAGLFVLLVVLHARKAGNA